MNRTRISTAITTLMPGIVPVAIAAVLTMPSTAQPLRPRTGITGGLAVAAHQTGFASLPGSPSCGPDFDRSAGTGLHVGVWHELPLSGALLVSLGAGYLDHSAKLTADEPLAIAVEGALQTGAIEHVLDASLGTIGVEGGVAWPFASGFVATGGVRLGVPLSSDYRREERIAEPSNRGTFLDALGNDSHSRTRNVTEGEIPDVASVLAHAVVGLRYELPINANGSLLLVPSISYLHGLTSAVDGVSWQPSAIRAGIGIAFSPAPERPMRSDTIVVRDTVVAEVDREPAGVELVDRSERIDRIEGDTVLETVTVTERYRREQIAENRMMVSVAAVGVDNGREMPGATLRIEEFLRTTSHPLLGYVFFEEGSDAIPERYVAIDREGAERFHPEVLFGEDALGIGHNVLNIIGWNLRQHPGARLTLTGTNMNTGSEQGNLDLSRRRAESVRRYLIERWSIDEGRISIAARNLPTTPSNPNSAEGREENRRVEITSDNPAVTDLFVVSDTTRSASPPGMRIRVGATPGELVDRWTIHLRQHGRTLREFNGRGVPPAVIDWTMADDERSIPRFDGPVEIELVASDAAGRERRATTSLQTSVVTLRQKMADNASDTAVEKYTLVLFPFGSSAITESHRRLVRSIASKLEPSSRVTIEGFTDQSGDADGNRRLALARARATAVALGRQGTTVRGVGEDRLLFRNDLPEGRFYCRTVMITVRTPVRRGGR